MKEYNIRHKTECEYSTSEWSGGTTTELGIGPEGSRYAERDFLWRISSATVELEESTFTALPAYDRIIMTLEGEMELCHNGGTWIHLSAFETHSFAGGDETVSRGKVRDFNLMMKKGAIGGALIPLVRPEHETVLRCRELLSELDDYKNVMIYCHRGSMNVLFEDGHSQILRDRESIWMEGNFSSASWEISLEDGSCGVMAAVQEEIQK